MLAAGSSTFRPFQISAVPNPASANEARLSVQNVLPTKARCSPMVVLANAIPATTSPSDSAPTATGGQRPAEAAGADRSRERVPPSGRPLNASVLIPVLPGRAARHGPLSVFLRVRTGTRHGLRTFAATAGSTAHCPATRRWHPG